MINECTGSSGASTVHALFYAAAEIGYFCIFAAQLYYHIRLGYKFFYGGRGGNNFLDKRYIQPLRNGKSARAGNFYGNRLLFTRGKCGFNLIESFINYIYNRTAYIRAMPPVIGINNIIVIIKNGNFYGSRAYIDSYSNRYNFFTGISIFFHKMPPFIPKW